jgi:cyclomaltodextrin glucanotransferase
MNKGGATTINLENTELPNGDYTCLLTGRSFTLQNSYFSNLYLGENECLVLSYLGVPIKAKMMVRAQLNGIQTQPGERIIVIGDCPELGNWDINQGYELEYINQNTWVGEIPFNESRGKTIAYKYALINNFGECRRENIQSRRWILATEGTVKWRDHWH